MKKISCLKLGSTMGIALLGAALSSPVFAEDIADMPVPSSDVTTTTTAPATVAKMNKNVEARIKKLHDDLKITADEESAWKDVAATMRDNAAKMSDAMDNRHEKASGMNAVDDIKSYQSMVQAHADSLSKFESSFSSLYDKMPPEQKASADKLFGHIREEHKEHAKHMAQ